MYSNILFWAVMLVQTSAAPQLMVTFCGDVSSSEASGASGYFQLNVVEGMAQYGYDLDLTNFDFVEAMGDDAAAACNPSAGLTWHLHSFWSTETDAPQSFAGTQCDVAGGHYDPNLACSENSQSHADLCPAIDRTLDQGYNYTCSPELYQAGLYSFCEMGDLSGKFGVAEETSQGSLKYSHKDMYTDLQPPYWSNYQHTWVPVSIQWTSVVFHCADTGARVACANMVRQPAGVMTCTPGDGENFDGLSELDYCIFATSLLVLLYGIYYKISNKGENRYGALPAKSHTPGGSDASLPSNYNLDQEK